MTADIIIRFLADALIVPVVLVGVFALIRYIPRGKRFEAYSRILMAGLTALLLAKLVAVIWQPEGVRPFIERGVNPGAAYLNNPGFPSDHVLFVSAITLAVYFETGKKRIALFLLIMTILIAIGRVLALVHTPIDVIGGALFACISALWYKTRLPRSHP